MAGAKSGDFLCVSLRMSCLGSGVGRGGEKECRRGQRQGKKLETRPNTASWSRGEKQRQTQTQMQMQMLMGRLRPRSYQRIGSENVAETEEAIAWVHVEREGRQLLLVPAGFFHMVIQLKSTTHAAIVNNELQPAAQRHFTILQGS